MIFTDKLRTLRWEQTRPHHDRSIHLLPRPATSPNKRNADGEPKDTPKPAPKAKAGLKSAISFNLLFGQCPKILEWYIWYK